MANWTVLSVYVLLIVLILAVFARIEAHMLAVDMQQITRAAYSQLYDDPCEEAHRG